MLEEGDLCPSCEEGRLAFPQVDDCSCHINPPCPACTNALLVCPVCGFRQDDLEEEEGA